MWKSVSLLLVCLLGASALEDEVSIQSSCDCVENDECWAALELCAESQYTICNVTGSFRCSSCGDDQCTCVYLSEEAEVLEQCEGGEEGDNTAADTEHLESSENEALDITVNRTRKEINDDRQLSSLDEALKNPNTRTLRRFLKLQSFRLKKPKIFSSKLSILKPKISKLDLSSLKIPSLKIPKISLPKIKLPKLNLPKLKLPTLKLQKFKLKLPKIKLPFFKFLKDKTPDKKFPKIKLPNRPKPGFPRPDKKPYKPYYKPNEKPYVKPYYGPKYPYILPVFPYYRPLYPAYRPQYHDEFYDEDCDYDETPGYDVKQETRMRINYGEGGEYGQGDGDDLIDNVVAQN
ncbi:uncharacterized protein LOC111137429 [Crassostrea virginica]